LLSRCLAFWVFAFFSLGSSSALATGSLGVSVSIPGGQPTTIAPGGTTEFQITLSNSDNQHPMTGVGFSPNLTLPGTLPYGLSVHGTATISCYNPTTGTTITDSSVGTLSATDGSQNISLSGTTIPAQNISGVQGTCTIIIPVTSGAGTSSGGASAPEFDIAGGAVIGTDNGAGVSNSGAVSQSINVSAISQPTITKLFGGSQYNMVVLGGSSMNLTIAVNNPNSIALPNFSITDNFPNITGNGYIKVAGTPSASCTGSGVAPTVTGAVGAISITASGGTIAAGGSCTITVPIVGNQTNGLFQTGYQTNNIPTTGYSDGFGLNSQATASDSADIYVQSPLAVGKSFSPSEIAQSQTSTLTITLYNNGSSPLTTSSFTDSPVDGYPAGGRTYSTGTLTSGGLQITAGPSISCSAGGTPGTVTDTANNLGVQVGVMTIAAGGTCTITATVTGTVQATNTPVYYSNVINTGTVPATMPGVSGTIVSEYASANILVSDTIHVLKSVSPGYPTTVVPGNPVEYTVTLENWTTSAMSNVNFTDTLSTGQTYLTGGSYNPSLSGNGLCSGLTVTNGALGSGSPHFNIANIPAISGTTQGSCTISFWAMTAKTGASANNGTVETNTLPQGAVCSGATCDQDSPNASTSYPTISTSVLGVIKSANPADLADTFSDPSYTLNENTITPVRITLTNASANTLSTTITDNFPTGLVLASPSNAVTTCTGGTLAATDGGNSVILTGTTVPARTNNGWGTLGSCYLQFNVVGPAGVYANTASVSATQTFADGTTGSISGTSNSATLTYNSVLANTTKSFSPSAVSSGGKSTVTVLLANSGASSLTNVQVIDPLPSGMVLANPVNAYTTCAGSTSFSGTAGAGSITMSGATVSGSGSCAMLFDVIATGSSNWTNTIPAGHITADGGIINQSAVAGTLNYSSTTNITVAKTTSPSTISFPGEVSQLTITIGAGSVAVSNLSLTDYFTANGTSGAAVNGMKIAPTPAASTTCPSGVVSATSGGSSVSLSGASLSSSTSCTVTVNVTSTAVGGITNYIPSGAVSTRQGLTNAFTESTSLTTESNIGVAKQFSPNVVQPGQRSRLTITFYNPEALPVSDLSLTDTLPSGITIPSGPNFATTCTGGTVSSPASNEVVISGANIVAASGGVSASCTMSSDVLVASQGDYVNTILTSAISATVGGAPATNSQPASDTLHAKSPIVIHKAIAGKTLDTTTIPPTGALPGGMTTGTASATIGSAATLTIALTNPNSADLTKANFTDSLPLGLVVALTPNASTTCPNGVVTAPASATGITLTGATLSTGSTCTVTVSVLSNISSSYTNTITASSVTTYEGVTNAYATSAEIVVANPPTVNKQFSPPIIAAGGKSTLTIYLGNTNSSAATLSAALTDTLPVTSPGVFIEGTPNVVKTCPGTVTTSNGSLSGSVTYASGAAIPAGGCSISVDVTAASAGSYVNSIPAAALQTNLGNNQDPTNATLTVSALGFVSGKVFDDNYWTSNSLHGVFNAGTDTAISGVSIQLYSGGSCSGTLVSAQTTDSNGNYLFSGLSAGTYSVCEPGQPSGTVNGITTAGVIAPNSGSTGAAGTALNLSATTSQITGIVLNGDGTSGSVSGSTGNNFAEVVPSVISGTVFLDQNNDGVEDGPDAGITGVTMTLTGTDINSLPVSKTTTTDSNGNYSFTNLVPGTYTVTETAPQTGSSNGITTAGSVSNGGTAGAFTLPTTLPSTISGIILPPNTTTTGNNFARIPDTRTITGTVFLDYNNDGLENNSDYGISGVTINLTGTDASGNAVSANTPCASDGTYSFSNLPPGTYTVVESALPAGTSNGITTPGSAGGTASHPSSTSAQIAGISLTASSVSTISSGNNFAEIPGAATDLTLTKTNTPSSFGQGSNTGYFTITPGNIGSVASTGTITVVDTLPAGMTVAAAASGTGWACTGAVGASSVTCTTNGVISASSSGNAITLRVAVAGGLSGQILTNTAVISGGGEPAAFTGNNTASDSVAISTTATVSGTVFLDTNHTRIPVSGDGISGWTAQLLLNGVLVNTATTAANGTYSFTNVSPGTGYEIRFLDPAGVVYGPAVANEQGLTPVNGTRDTGSTVNSGTDSGNPAGATVANGILSGLTVLAGDNIVQQSLPVDPSGIIYDAVTRNPVAGAQITISGPAGFNPATQLVGGSAIETTGFDGIYQFLLLSGAPSGTYTLAITSYPAGYIPLTSSIIPVCSDTLTVGATPNPALVQTSNTAPAAGTANETPSACPSTSASLSSTAGTTQYYYTFNLTSSSANVVNNHIPLDPYRAGDLIITKTTPLVNVNIGQLVPYTITVRNISAAVYTGIDIVDTLPPGFKYKSGTGSLNGVRLAPILNGRTMTWKNQSVAAGATLTFKMFLVVGSGVQPGNYTNSAQVLSTLTQVALSNVATATVRVVPDPLFDCSEVIGKVFDDKNGNGYQDQGEPGIPNVRLATVDGLLVTTDAEGRFHIACAAVPDPDHGSHFVMKIDERTLPSGYRVTTENPRDVLLTRGKMSKINFGASIQRVVRIDMNNEAFEAGSTQLKKEWAEQMGGVTQQLKSRPSILRISYTSSDEDLALARKRLKEVSDQFRKIWGNKDHYYDLVIEEELFTPPGNPGKRGSH
jgi:uncharacterized repeat protein (TIGR01451 family)